MKKGKIVKNLKTVHLIVKIFKILIPLSLLFSMVLVSQRSTSHLSSSYKVLMMFYHLDVEVEIESIEEKEEVIPYLVNILPVLHVSASTNSNFTQVYKKDCYLTCLNFFVDLCMMLNDLTDQLLVIHHLELDNFILVSNL